MQHKNAQPIGVAITQFLKENKLDGRMNETHLIQAWSSVLGNAVSNYTTSIFVKNRILHVQLSSSVLRQELQMSRERIVFRLNEFVGKEVITDIIFR
jgi:hypothetical protein